MTKKERARLVRDEEFPYTIGVCGEEETINGLWRINSKQDERMFIDHANPGKHYVIYVRKAAQEVEPCL